MTQIDAIEWGLRLAAYFHSQRKINPFLLAAQYGWRVIFETEEKTDLFVPACLAEWDGSQRTIRIFPAALYRLESESESALYRACAHELFHGLAASNYRRLPPALRISPRLNFAEEEMAAGVFADTLLRLSE
jgi:hypothetical protein